MNQRSPATARILIAGLVVVAVVAAQEGSATSRPGAESRAGEAQSIVAARAHVARSETDHGPDSRELAAALRDLARSLKAAGRTNDAVAAAQQALAVLERNPASKRTSLALARAEIAIFLNDAARYAEALPIARAAADDALAGWGPDNRQTAQLCFILGNVAKMAGRLDESEAALRRTLPAARVTPPILRIQFLNALGEVLTKLGRYGEARRFLSEAGALMRTTADVRVSGLLADASAAALALGDVEQAAALADRMVASMNANRDDEPGRRARASLSVAAARHGLGHPADALPIFDEAMALARRGQDDFHQLETSVLVGKGQALSAVGRKTEARACFRSAADACTDALVGHSAMLSELERLSILRAVRGAFDIWLSCAVDDPAAAAEVAAQTLTWKGRVLRSMQAERSRLRARETPELAGLRARLAQVESGLAAAAVPGAASRPASGALIAEREDIERSLARLATGVAARSVTPEEVYRRRRSRSRTT